MIALAVALFLGFVRSGIIRIGNSGNSNIIAGRLAYPGYGGDYWSKTTANEARSAYYLHFYIPSVTPEVRPTTYLDRYLGFPLRCLAD